MPRDLPLANGRLLVNFDANYDLRDIYWPHIGERNQTRGHVNRTGVWVDGEFAWLDDAEWQRELHYEDDTLVTSVTLTTPAPDHLKCSDTVDFDRDLFVRRVRVTNEPTIRARSASSSITTGTLGERGRQHRLFSPKLKVLVAYKDDCYFLVDGLVGDEDAGLAEGGAAGGAASPVGDWQQRDQRPARHLARRRGRRA